MLPPDDSTEDALRRPTIAPDAPVADAIAQLRAFLTDGDIQTARALAVEALLLHPDDPTVQRYSRVLAGASETADPRSVLAAADRKLVAMVDGEVIATGSTMEEIHAALPGDLDHTPLIVRMKAG